MASSIEILRQNFLQILEDIRVVTDESSREGKNEQPNEGYESCIRIGGKPIIPPLMTSSKRGQCLDWKRQALEVEERLAQKRRDKLLKAIDDLKNEADVVTRPNREDPRQQSARYTFEAVMASKSSFAPPATLDSTPTKQERPSATIDIDAVMDPGEEADREDHDDEADRELFSGRRQRRDSYTLTEPSPVLLAYMEQYGTEPGADESPRPRRRVSTKSPIVENHMTSKSQLDDYLQKLSLPPSVKSTPVATPKKVDPQPKVQVIDEDATPRAEVSIGAEVPKLPLEVTEDSEVIITPRNEEIVISPSRCQVVVSMTPTKGALILSPRGDFNSAVKPKKLEFSPLKVEIDIPPAESTIPPPSEILDTSFEKSESVTLPTHLQGGLDSPTSRNEVDENDEESTATTVTTTTRRSQIESAISRLAVQQQNEIQRLMDQQSKEREQMKKMFAEQQQQLITKVLQEMKLGEDSPAPPVRQSVASEATLTPTTPNLNTAIRRSTSPLIPTVKPKIDPESLSLPQDYQLPDAASTPVNRYRFERLSAIVKGHLTRRLLKTERVQGIVQSMRDSLGIALRLHRETSDQQPRMEDVELHRRLLQQLQKDSQWFHDIFFKYSVQQRMSIIRLDRDMKFERQFRGGSHQATNEKPKKRVSAVTMARLQHKQNAQDNPQVMFNSDPSNLNVSPTKRRRMRSQGRSPRPGSRGKSY